MMYHSLINKTCHCCGKRGIKYFKTGCYRKIIYLSVGTALHLTTLFIFLKPFDVEYFIPNVIHLFLTHQSQTNTKIMEHDCFINTDLKCLKSVENLTSGTRPLDMTDRIRPLVAVVLCLHFVCR